MSISQTRSPRYYAIGLLGVGIALLFLFSQLGPVQSATQKSKRTFESAIPSQVPLKVKIKKEKEDKALDTENKDWFRDIEIEITNTSDKPIYFLSLDVVMKDVLTDAGVMMSFPIRYGRTDFYDHNTKPTREDIPIEPKATMTFSFEEDNKIGWEAWRRKHKRNDPLKLEVWFHHLNFGDGTGFTSLNALPFPFKQEEVGRCFEKSRAPDQWAKTPTMFSALYAENFKAPADLLPVNLFRLVLLREKRLAPPRRRRIFVVREHPATNLSSAGTIVYAGSMLKRSKQHRALTRLVFAVPKFRWVQRVLWRELNARSSVS